MSVKKYFIAIVLLGPLFAEIEGIKQTLFKQYGLKGALRSPAHITLHRPFEWKEEKENVLIEKLNAFNFSHNFEININGFNWFEPRVIYVAVEKNNRLNELQKKLKYFAARELKLLNEVEDERGFHPHITVAFRDLKKPVFYELQKNVMHQKIEGGFSYNGFSLLKLHDKWEELEHFKVLP